MQVGKKVVCVNDVFTPEKRQFFRQLPVEGVVYTVREVSLGREKVAHVENGKFVPGRASESVTVGVLLHELHNGPDPMHVGGAELRFNAERFREVEEAPDQETKVGVGEEAFA